jgi:hypothetical protein
LSVDQCDPKEILKLLDPMEEKRVEIIIGSRFIGDSIYKASAMRKAGLSILSPELSQSTDKRQRFIPQAVG